ncbi:hypothetical protein FJZ53_04835 [Candidatus Woesearchaeota archaeon]|nr:hypothetical protein [Candidatus Woesearchaeota archaeon]
MVDEIEIKLSKEEAQERFENLKKEVTTMEWDIQHHGLKLKQGLYDKKKSELDSLRNFLGL